jgi:hypothetical protein
MASEVPFFWALSKNPTERPVLLGFCERRVPAQRVLQGGWIALWLMLIGVSRGSRSGWGWPELYEGQRLPTAVLPATVGDQACSGYCGGTVPGPGVGRRRTIPEGEKILSPFME